MERCEVAGVGGVSCWRTCGARLPCSAGDPVKSVYTNPVFGDIATLTILRRTPALLPAHGLRRLASLRNRWLRRGRLAAQQVIAAGIESLDTGPRS